MLLIITESFDLKSESSKTILYIINTLMKRKVYKRRRLFRRVKYNIEKN